MEAIPAHKEYTPSTIYLSFLREAIKGGYKPSLQEKLILKKYGAKTSRAHPRAGFGLQPRKAEEIANEQ